MKNRRTLAWLLAFTVAAAPVLWAAVNNADIAPDAAIATTKLADSAKFLGTRYSPGTMAVNVLRVAANVANGETVTIGSSVFEVDIINTDSTKNLSGNLNNSSDPVQVTFDAAITSPQTPVAGDLFRIDNEIFKILRVVSSTSVVALRARCGTSIASHSSTADVFVSDAAPAANVPVGLVTTLTPAVFTPALVQEIINAAAANGERSTSKASGIYATHTATSLQSGAEMLLKTVSAAATATACTETLAGANNVWSAATMYGGSAKGFKKVAQAKRTPTATEVALGTIRMPLDFTPTMADVWVITTSTGVAKVWDGARTISSNLLTVDNAGATDWAATDDVYLVAYE